MPLGTLDRQPPPFFRQGASALSRLLVCSALAILLMVSDSRFALIEPVRAVMATLLYPLQWLVLQPVFAVRAFKAYTESRDTAQQREQAAQAQLLAQSLRAQQVEQLRLENAQLRRLLELRGQTAPTATAAQVLYEALDPFSRKLIIDKGQMHGVAAGSPVVDAQGVVGQVTRVYPLLSEVTLVIAPEHAIPVLNTRTGTRSVAFGSAASGATALELRFLATNADVQEGDLLTTSGVDGVYPPGVPVAKVEAVERQADAAFARIRCRPVGAVDGVTHVLVLAPAVADQPPRPGNAPPDKPAARKGNKP